MAQLFVSYAREDKTAIDALVANFGILGHQSWIDSSLRGGDDWWAEILRRITGCDIFIVAVSRASMSSGACQREFDWAEALRKPVVPVAVEPLPTALPTRLSKRQIIDYTHVDHTAALRLAGALAAAPPAPPLPQQLPTPPQAPLSYLTVLIDQVLSSEALDHAAQRQIISRTETALRSVDREERSSGRDVLNRLMARQDLYADVDRALRQLDSAHDEHGSTTASGSAPTGAAPPQAPCPLPSHLLAHEPPSKVKKRRLPKNEEERPPKVKKQRPPSVKAEPRETRKQVSPPKVKPLPKTPLSSSVFAPPAVDTASTFMVQVFVHLPDDSTEVEKLARSFDDSAEARGAVGLLKRVRQGDRLAIELLLPGLTARQPVREVIWHGQRQAVQYLVEVPSNFQSEGPLWGTVTISRNRVPIGNINFKVIVRRLGGEESPDADDSMLAGTMHRYRRAFISYASADRREVLKRAQMLEVEGIDFFQDILSLKPGQRYERLLFSEIDRCDVFYLFWSSAAKKSEWVTKEVQLALKRNGESNALPHIVPVIIEGPPPAPPPRELEHLHFNDRMIYFIDPKRIGWFSKLLRRDR